MYERRTEIMQNVFLTYLPASKFKTSVLSAHLVTPLSKETASANALLPAVLRRGTMRCPDMESLSAALDTLYGAQIDYTVRKKGERQCIGFVASVIDDAFAPAGEKLLEPVSDLLGELFLDPVTRNGRFLAEYVDSEKQNLIDAIRAIRNDKQDWADVRLMQEMCAGEPYGVLRLGDEESAAKINNHKLFNHYRELLATSRVEMFYMGSIAPEQVTEVLRQTLQALPRAGQVVPVGTTPAPAARPVQEKTERLDVTQGKLSLGFFTDITANDPRYPALVLAATVFGGGATSKLFTNVREQMSLCYYASASFEKFKGVLAVASGVEFSKLETAKKEILRQLEACCSGEISDYELESARGYLVSDLKIAMDSPGRLDDFYMGQILLESSATMQDLSDAIARVTKEEAAQAARALRLDTIYELQGVQA